MRAAGAKGDRATLGRVHEQPADVWMRSERGDELRVPLVDLLERQPALLLHQVDEAEVARAEHDDIAVGDVVLRPLRRLAGRLFHRAPDHRALLVTARDPRHGALGERTLDELVQAVTVPLLERRALRLAMVREDDNLVGPRGVLPRALDQREPAVELAERLERVGSLEA